MSSHRYVGRVGGLALALGVGAGLLTNCAIAAADTSAADPAGSTASDTAAPDPAKAGPARAGVRAARIAADSRSVSANPRRGKLPGAANRATRRAAAGALRPAAAVQAPPAVDVASVPAAADLAAPAALAGPAPAAEPTPVLFSGQSNPLARLAAAVFPALHVPAKAGLMVQAPAVTTRPAAGVTGRLGALAQLGLAVSAAASTTTTSSASSASQSSSTPTLVIDGYNAVPTNTETVYTFYGRWTSLPGLPNSLQGSQSFKLVDPQTQQTLGNFDALLSSGDPTSIGTKYVSMLVTANDGVNVGTDPGQIPPVGSLISTWTIGPLGLYYAAMPSPTGDKVTFKLTTPFGSIKLPMPFDAAKGIADHTFDNRPMDLGNGFRIAPADPTGEVLTGSAGVLPLFSAVQGVQRFDMLDANGQSVGGFDGEFTTTADVLGLYTQAILVTANDGTNVGTDPGQIPPVGTVYNVIYFFTDNLNLIYSSSPVSYGSGSVTTTKLLTPGRNFTIPIELLNTSKPPKIKLAGVGGKTYVPTSDFIPGGINGLPPRDVQYQGYQQFNVQDFSGKVIGSVDADVTTQWSFTGTKSEALLITNIRSGKSGLGPTDVPPVGTTMTMTYFPIGLGYSDAVFPRNGFDVNAFSLQTFFGEVPLFPLFLPVRNRPVLDYYNPFLEV